MELALLGDPVTWLDTKDHKPGTPEEKQRIEEI